MHSLVQNAKIPSCLHFIFFFSLRYFYTSEQKVCCRFSCVLRFCLPVNLTLVTVGVFESSPQQYQIISLSVADQAEHFGTADVTN